MITFDETLFLICGNSLTFTVHYAKGSNYQEKNMNAKEIELFKNLISTIEGAPYPVDWENELYQIWFEHSKETVNDALAYLNTHYPDKEEE